MFNVYDEIENTASMMAQYAGRAAAFPSFRGYFHTGAGRMSSRIFALFGSADTPCSADEGFRRFGSTAVDGGGSCIQSLMTPLRLATIAVPRDLLPMMCLTRLLKTGVDQPARVRLRRPQPAQPGVGYHLR